MGNKPVLLSTPLKCRIKTDSHISIPGDKTVNMVYLSEIFLVQFVSSSYRQHIVMYILWVQKMCINNEVNKVHPTDARVQSTKIITDSLISKNYFYEECKQRLFESNFYH